MSLTIITITSIMCSDHYHRITIAYICQNLTQSTRQTGLHVLMSTGLGTCHPPGYSETNNCHSFIIQTLNIHEIIKVKLKLNDAINVD